MYDVFLSYSSTHRGFAERVARDLVDRGISVWMDDPDSERGDAEMGVPAGTRWRDSIKDGLDSSMLVVVLDSGAWRASGVCRWEYDYAFEAGKRITVLPVQDGVVEGGGPGETVRASTGEDPVDRIVRLAGEHEELVRAHTRMLSVQSAEQTGLLGRWFGADRIADDVEAVLAEDLAPIGVRLGDRHRAVIEAALASEDARRKRTRTARISTLAVVAVLAAGAVVSSIIAVRANDRSQVERRNQVSVMSAGEAVSAGTSREAEEALSRGRQAADTIALRAAAQVVDAKNRESEIVYSGVDQPTGVAISDDGTVVTVSEREAITVIRGDQDPVLIAAPGPLSAASLTMSQDGAQVAVLGKLEEGISSYLYLLDTETGEFQEVEGRFRDVVLMPDGSLLTTDQAGTVQIDGMTIVDIAGFDSFPVAAASLSGGVAVLLDSGAIALPDSSGRYRVVDTFTGQEVSGTSGSPEDVATKVERLAPQEVAESRVASAKSRSRPARIFVCGDRVIAWDRGTLRSVGVDGSGATSRRILNYLNSDQSRACFDGQGHFAAPLAGHMVSFPIETGLPRSILRDNPNAGGVSLATSSNEMWIVAARPDGTVSRAFSETTPRHYDSDDVFLRLPSSSGLLSIMSDGGVRLNGDRLEGHSVARLIAQRVATVDDGFWFPSGRWMYKLSESGIDTEIVIEEEIGVTSARTASDGSVVMTGRSAALHVDPVTGNYSATVVSMPEGAGEILDVDVLESGVLVVLTESGHLLAVEAESGGVIRSERVSAGGIVGAVTRIGEGQILVMASDGVLRELDSEFNEVRSMQWRGGARQIDLLDEGRRVLVSGPRAGTILVDVEDLAVVDILDQSDSSAQAVTRSPAGDRVVSNLHYGTQDLLGENLGVSTTSVERYLAVGG